MGSEAFDRARGAASRGGRRGKLGKVFVLPGIMGSELDSVDRSGDADRIWINFFNLIRGRIDELELTAEGKPAKPGVRVRTAGVHRATYLPLILDLVPPSRASRSCGVRAIRHDTEGDVWLQESR